MKSTSTQRAEPEFIDTSAYCRLVAEELGWRNEPTVVQLVKTASSGLCGSQLDLLADASSEKVEEEAIAIVIALHMGSRPGLWTVVLSPSVAMAEALALKARAVFETQTHRLFFPEARISPKGEFLNTFGVAKKGHFASAHYEVAPKSIQGDLVILRGTDWAANACAMPRFGNSAAFLDRRSLEYLRLLRTGRRLILCSPRTDPSFRCYLEKLAYKWGPQHDVMPLGQVRMAVLKSLQESEFVTYRQLQSRCRMFRLDSIIECAGTQVSDTRKYIESIADLEVVDEVPERGFFNLSWTLSFVEPQNMFLIIGVVVKVNQRQHFIVELVRHQGDFLSVMQRLTDVDMIYDPHRHLVQYEGLRPEQTRALREFGADLDPVRSDDSYAASRRFHLGKSAVIRMIRGIDHQDELRRQIIDLSNCSSAGLAKAMLHHLDCPVVW